MTTKRKPKIFSVAQDSGRLLCFMGIAAFVTYAALRIDLLAIIASLLIGLHFSAYLLARASMRGLRIHFSATPSRVRAGEPTLTTLRLVNRNRFLPVFYPVLSLRQEGTLRVQAFQFQGMVAPRKAATLTADPSFDTRGLHRLEAFAPRSLFPFALHETTSTASATSHPVVVWPAPAPVDLDALFHEPPRSLFETTGENALPHNTSEATRIRDYQPGDPKPRINWKLSAKLDKLTVIEPRNQVLQRYELHLDTSRDLWRSELAFERMLRLSSSVIAELAQRKLLQGVTVDETHYPLTTQQQSLRFYDALAQLHATNRKVEDAFQHSFSTQRQTAKRCHHLWILPAPNSSIVLSSMPHDIESFANA